MVGLLAFLLLGPLSFVFVTQDEVEMDQKIEIDNHVSVSTTPAGDEILIDDYQNYYKNNYYEESPQNLYIDNQTLFIETTYGGGCEDHYFLLVFPGDQLSAQPPDRIELVLMHNNNNDVCQALISETLKYDLSYVLDAMKNKYGTIPGSFTIVIMDKEVEFYVE